MAQRVKAPPRPLAVKGRGVRWDGERWTCGKFWYDEKAADAVVAFMHGHLCFTKGEWANKPFRLEAWEEHDIVRPLFGWKRADGTRRYRRCFVWVARKNGKTELAAAVALVMLLGDAEPGGEVYSIASEKDQASIVFNKAASMVAYSKSLSALIEPLKTAIYVPRLNASFRPLSGKPAGKHGLNMSGLIGDEIHEWKNGDLYTFVHDSGSSRRQPLELLISTAGVIGTHGQEVYEECLAILNGEVDDPETLVVIYAAGEDDDWTDPATWAKANPNLGVSVKLETLAADCRRAQQLPRLENDFKRYRLNMWTEQSVRWLPIDGVDDDGRRFGWDHCVGATPWRDLEEKLRFKRCFGGLDLSSTTDLSALVWWFPVQDGLERPAVLARFFKPEALIKVHSKRDRLPYDRWADPKMGALTATPGNVVDYGFIQEQIYRDAERFRIAFVGEQDRDAGQGGLAIDRWNATETAVKLQQEGLPIVLFGQGFASMAAPTKELERLVISNGFDHGGHPVLRQHAKSVSVVKDAADNLKPDKENAKTRIDGIVALVMALGIAARDEGEQTSVYEERGMLEIDLIDV